MFASTTELITGGLGDFTASALIILAAVIGLAVGLLVFRWGWRKVRGAAK